MKFRTIFKEVAGTYTRDGVTIPRTRTEAVQVPALPRDWQTIALRSAVIIVVALTGVAIVWSTVSIGNLLGGGVGFAAAIMYDAGWAVALVLAYLARYDARKRKFPEYLGWILLAVSMIAIFLHSAMPHGAWVKEGVAMGIVGAGVSLISKVLWMGVMHHVNAELSEDDAAWLAAQISDAQTKAAVAQVRRQTARIENAAAIELLAMERELADVRAAFGLEVETVAAVPAIEAPSLADMGKADAIRYVVGQRPELDAAEVAALLADHGVSTKPEYVTQVVNRAHKPEPSNVVNFVKEA